MAPGHRAEIGWLAEQTLDMRLVAPSHGRAVPWIPLVDAHGIDRAYSWDAIGPPAFVQVKTSGFTDAEGRHRWDVRVGSFPTHARFLVVLGISDPHWGPNADIYWCLNARAVQRHARREYDRAMRAEVYRLDASPVHRDHLSRYRCRGEDLWRILLPGADAPAARVLRFPTLRIDEGGVYEFATVTDLMIDSKNDLLVMRPAFDIHGRDLLVHLVGSPDALYLQVKGTGMLRGDDLVRFHIRRSTFVPADDFWVAMRFYDRRRGALYPESWLVSSRELARRTAHERDAHYITVDVRLNRAVDRWADRRYASSEIGNVLRGALRQLRSAA